MRWVGVSLVIWFILTEGLNLILGQIPDWIWWFGFLLLPLILIGKVYRYRHLSNPIERQQIRWFLFALMVFSVYGTLQFIFVRVFPISPQPGPLELMSYLVGIYLSDFIFLLIPIAIAIAIFRYRLWDIDLIIRRTLQYGLLTVLLGLVYFGMVVLLGQVFRTISGQESPWRWCFLPWRLPPCSPRCAGASRPSLTGAFSAASTMPNMPWPFSARTCASGLTCLPSRASWWGW